MRSENLVSQGAFKGSGGNGRNVDVLLQISVGSLITTSEGNFTDGLSLVPWRAELLYGEPHCFIMTHGNKTKTRIEKCAIPVPSIQRIRKADLRFQSMLKLGGLQSSGTLHEVLLMRPDQFPVTRWTLVANAGHESSEQAAQALASLCQMYWYPLYAFIRRQGYLPDEAQDLTQEFFARLLEKHYLRDCQRERGRFRSFLLSSVKHFLANERDRAYAQKRGGGCVSVSIDEVTQTGENRSSLEPHHHTTPETVFARRWALRLLGQTLGQLQTEFDAEGKTKQFARLKVVLMGNETHIPYRELAKSMGTTEGALKVALHRLRGRFREVLREEISRIVSHPDEIQEEIRYLSSVLSR